jgi:endoglucanase
MKRVFRILIFLLSGLCFTFCSSSASASKLDFDIEVEVPDTSSSIKQAADEMNKTMTAVELTKKMVNGINLGNTLEAYRGLGKSTSEPVLSYETFWGQPVTTQEIMNAYKSAGFNSVRIPVAWTNMMDYEKGNYVINPDYLDRVETVVNYALSAGLYAIINDHWDGQWWGMFGASNKSLRQEAVKLYKSLWTQVGVRFKNYDEHLIFEGANEELGSRLNDDTALTPGRKGVLSEIDCYNMVNKINQCFVDVIRASGGNNEYRFLLIPGYDTDIGKTNASSYKMPADKVQNRLLISVHYYTPSTYCILDEDASWGRNQTSWGTSSDKSLMNDNFAKMKKFVDAGYGVIIGEYGVTRQKDGSQKEGMVDWLTCILNNCDNYNYCPMLWDCNTFFRKESPFGFSDSRLAELYLSRKE